MGVLDHDLHQLPADAVALEVGADQDAVFATVVIGIGMQAHRTQHLAAARVDGHQGNGAGVVQLGQARDELVAEVLHRLEEAQAQVIVGHPGEERAEQTVVLRPHRPDEGLAAVGQGNGALPLGGIREDRKARVAPALVQASHRGDGDACIQCDHAVTVGQQWVQVQCADLRDIRRQLRQFDQHQRHRTLVRRRHIAIGLEDARYTGPSYHLMGQAQVQRRQCQGLVVDHFHRGTATAEDHHRAKHRVVGNAGNQFACFGPGQAGLHQHALDARLRALLAGTLQDGGGRSLYRTQGAQVQAHAIDFGFVRDVRREDLHRHAQALFQQWLGQVHRLVRVARHHHLQRGDAIGLQQLVGSHRIQPLLVVGQCRLHQRARRSHVHHEIGGQAGWGFHQRSLCLAVLHQVLEAPYRLGLAGIGRHPRGVEGNGGAVIIAQPYREHRLVAQLPRAQPQRAGQRLRGLGRRGECGGHVDHQHRIVGIVGQQGLDGRCIAATVGVHHDVHRVVA